MTDIVILTILGVLCGADSWDAIELFGKKKQDFLKKLLKLSNGIPSHDDRQRKRVSNAAQNFALAQRIGLNLLKADKSLKASLKSKRLVAAWDNDYLLSILMR